MVDESASPGGGFGMDEGVIVGREAEQDGDAKGDRKSDEDEAGPAGFEGATEKQTANAHGEPPEN